MSEPWGAIPPGLTIEDVKGVWDADGEHVATFHDKDARRRALACVNACAGIPTERLEANGLSIKLGVLRSEQDTALAAAEAARLDAERLLAFATEGLERAAEKLEQYAHNIVTPETVTLAAKDARTVLARIKTDGQQGGAT